VTVVPIDNGSGAAYVATMILRRIQIGSREHSVYNQVS
jgi:NCAIR mutase (PurE)-related protein